VQGRLSPNGNGANLPLPFPSLSFPFPSPPLSLPFPFPPFLLYSRLPPLPGGLGAEPPVAGVRGDTRKKMEIEIGFGAFWRIFVSKRQPSSVSLFTYDPYIWVNSFPSGCNSLPLSPIWTQFASTPPVDAPAFVKPSTDHLDPSNA